MFPYGSLLATRLPGDPVQARAARRKLWLLTAPTALAWAVVGWSGALGILDQFRTMSLNRVGAWDAAGASSVSLTMIFSIVITVASMLGFSMTWTGAKAFGWFGSGFSAGSFATFLGLTVGTAFAMSSWTAPEAVGSRLPFSSGQPAEPWSSADWVIYYEPYLVPAVFGVVALVTGAMTLRAAWRTAKQEDAEGAIRRLGRRVQGTIEHAEFTHVWVLGEPQFRVRVTYPGATGTRTVVTTMTTSPFAAPMAGGTVDVLYAPADDESVIIEAQGGQSSRF